MGPGLRKSVLRAGLLVAPQAIGAMLTLQRPAGYRIPGDLSCAWRRPGSGRTGPAHGQAGPRVQIRQPASYGDTSVSCSAGKRPALPGTSSRCSTPTWPSVPPVKVPPSCGLTVSTGLRSALGAGLDPGSPAPHRHGKSTHLRPPGRRHSDQPARRDRCLAGRPWPDPGPGHGRNRPAPV